MTEQEILQHCAEALDDIQACCGCSSPKTWTNLLAELGYKEEYIYTTTYSGYPKIVKIDARTQTQERQVKHESGCSGSHIIFADGEHVCLDTEMRALRSQLDIDYE